MKNFIFVSPQITDYFSYEHFYVIYCKFWELDSDHDLLIDAQDLSRHADHGEKLWGTERGGGCSCVCNLTSTCAGV